MPFQFSKSYFVAGAFTALVWVAFADPVKKGLDDLAATTAATTSLLCVAFSLPVSMVFWAIALTFALIDVVTAFLFSARPLVKFIIKTKLKITKRVKKHGPCQHTSKSSHAGIVPHTEHALRRPTSSLLRVAIVPLVVFQYMLMRRAAKTSPMALASIPEDQCGEVRVPEENVEEDVDSIPGDYNVGYEFMATEWLVLLLTACACLFVLDIGGHCVHFALSLLKSGPKDSSCVDSMSADDSILTLVDDSESEIKHNSPSKDAKFACILAVQVPPRPISRLFASKSAPALSYALDDLTRSTSRQLGSDAPTVILSGSAHQLAEDIPPVPAPTPTQDSALGLAADLDPEPILVTFQPSTSEFVPTAQLTEILPVQDAVLPTTYSIKTDICSTLVSGPVDEDSLDPSSILPPSAVPIGNKSKFRLTLASKLRSFGRRFAAPSASSSRRSIILPAVKSMNLFAC